jgi:glycerol-3-phosphate dehydrogenase
VWVKDIYDVAVIGGGVNGTGIARDCAMRGLKVILLDKEDLSAGTTGACSGMIHGGLRYLYSDVGTTKVSCQDSGYIRKIAPHLIFRIPFIAPVLERGLFSRIFLELMEAYFTAYDRFAPLKSGKPHTRLSREEALRLAPGLSPRIIGAVTMDEWGIDPFRLCVANALSAQEHGAEVQNHTEVIDFIRPENNGIAGVKVKNLLTREVGLISARIVMNAAGPWLTRIGRTAGVEVRIRPAKGIHLVFDRRISNLAIDTSAIDGRQIFLMPHENTSILGTTDDDFYGDPDSLTVTEDEVEYLLQGMERVFPGIRDHRIIRAFAGIRPTLYAWGGSEDSLYREHEIFDHETRDGLKGLITIAGGKLASYRLMSEQATDLICKKLGIKVNCRTRLEALPGGEKEVSVEELAKRFSLPMYVIKRMIYRQGARAERILEMIKDDPSGGNLICRCEPVTEAEIRYCIRNEWVKTLADLRRRTRMGSGPCQGSGCTVAAAQIMAEELKLSPEESQQLIFDFLKERWKGKAPILKGIQLSQEELNQAKHLCVGSFDKMFK